MLVGDDQHEWFQPDVQPSFTVFYGEEVVNTALDEDKAKRAQPGLAYVMKSRHPPKEERYPVASELAARDTAAIFDEPNAMFQSGTSETKNWIAVAGILSETRLRMNLLDYVPCYRSDAGTGNAMAFATWE